MLLAGRGRCVVGLLEGELRRLLILEHFE